MVSVLREGEAGQRQTISISSMVFFLYMLKQKLNCSVFSILLTIFIDCVGPLMSLNILPLCF